MEFNYYVPFFPGFYNSILENGDTEYWAIQETVDYYKDELGEDVTEDDFEFDNDTRRKDIIEAFISTLKEFVPDWVIDIEFNTLVSPRYYNFESDRIDAKFTLADNWREEMTKVLADKEIREIISKEWRSRDGFCSFMSSNPTEWDDEIKKENPDERYLETIIKYAMLISQRDANPKTSLEKIFDDMLEIICVDTLEYICDSSYVHKKSEKTE